MEKSVWKFKCKITKNEWWRIEFWILSVMGVCILIVDDGAERILDSIIELHLDDKSSHLQLSWLFVSIELFAWNVFVHVFTELVLGIGCFVS